MKSLKKCISLVLVLALALICSVSTACAAADYNHLPKIYVNGIGSRAVYMADDPEKTPVFFPMNSDLLMQNLGNLGEYLKSSAKNLDPDIVYALAYNLMWDTCGNSVLDTDGPSQPQGLLRPH